VEVVIVSPWGEVVGKPECTTGYKVLSLKV
jgi:hypothetical protein